MILKPRWLDTCIMCQPAPAREASYTSAREIDLHYCEQTCEPDGANGFVTSSQLGTAPTPHLHACCTRCGYRWLLETSQNYPPPWPPPQAERECDTGLRVQVVEGVK